jgi:hypothetical protein
MVDGVHSNENLDQLDFDIREASPIRRRESVFGLKLASMEEICEFEKNLKIEIPRELLGQNRFYDMDCFFSSDKQFRMPFPGSKLVDLARKGRPLFAFGQSGHGFNSGKFDIYFSGDGFAYHFTMPFGGAFMDNDEGAKYISRAFAALNEFTHKTLPGSDADIIGIMDDSETVEFMKIDKISGKIHPMDPLNFYESSPQQSKSLSHRRTSK